MYVALLGDLLRALVEPGQNPGSLSILIRRITKKGKDKQYAQPDIITALGSLGGETLHERTEYLRSLFKQEHEPFDLNLALWRKTGGATRNILVTTLKWERSGMVIKVTLPARKQTDGSIQFLKIGGSELPKSFGLSGLRLQKTELLLPLRDFYYEKSTLCPSGFNARVIAAARVGELLAKGAKMRTVRAGNVEVSVGKTRMRFTLRFEGGPDLKEAGVQRSVKLLNDAPPCWDDVANVSVRPAYNRSKTLVEVVVSYTPSQPITPSMLTHIRQRSEELHGQIMDKLRLSKLDLVTVCEGSLVITVVLTLGDFRAIASGFSFVFVYNLLFCWRDEGPGRKLSYGGGFPTELVLAGSADCLALRLTNPKVCSVSDPFVRGSLSLAVIADLGEAEIEIAPGVFVTNMAPAPALLHDGAGESASGAVLAL